MTAQSEFKKGFDNGKRAFEPIPFISEKAQNVMFLDNWHKANMQHEEILVNAYWQGWRQGLETNKPK